MNTYPNNAPNKPISGPAEWPAVAGLLALSAIPSLAGVVRLIGLASGPAVTPDNARFVAAPLPVVIHIVAVTLFSVLGAFQFAPGFRRRRPAWHRAAGRVLMVCGIASSLSGLWMTQFYPLPAPLQGPLLYGFRLLIGLAMFAAIALSWSAILRRDVTGHQAWMMRGYAIGMGAGTQALILLPWPLLLGDALWLTRDLLMIAAWVINLIVAEWIIRRKVTRSGGARDLALAQGSR